MKLNLLFLRKTLGLFGLLFLSFHISAQSLSLNMFKSDISCAGLNDGNAGADVSGGQQPYTFLWSNNQQSQTISDLSPDVYIVTVTDATGNTISAGVNLPALDPISVELITEDGFCGDGGKIRAVVTGGVGPFQYIWSNNKIETEIRDLEQGVYSVTVTDRGECDIVESAEVIVNGEGLSLTSEFNLPSCVGDSDGMISISQTGGQMPIDYMWENGNLNTTRENISAGTYSIFAVDAYGCTDGIVIILPDPDLLEAEIINQNNSLFAKAEGGTPAYEYTWSNGITGSTVISNLEVGAYSLTIEDSKGCSAIAFGDILAPLSASDIVQIEKYTMYPSLVQNELNIQVDLKGSENLSFEIYSVQGQRLKSYSSNGQNIKQSITDLSALSTGLYILHVSSSAGWSFSDKFIKQ